MSSRRQLSQCFRCTACVAAAAVISLSATGAVLAAKPDTRLPGFRRMLVGTLSLPDEAFLKFVERIGPEVVVMGAFGAPQWAAQEDPRAWLDQWRGVFARMHKADVKVVGMIELLNVGGNSKEVEHWFDFYEHRWDERLLGKRPDARGTELLEQRAIPPERQTGIHAPRGCAVNPHWRAVEKALVGALIEAGIDGFITHRNMFGECGCPFCHADWNAPAQPAGDKTKPPRQHKHTDSDDGAKGHVCDHCRGGLRRWLADRYTKQQLRKRFNITDLAGHRLPHLYGHHLDHDKLPSPLALEGMKFARHAIKEAFDDVMVGFARSKQPDLIVAQWNHMPYFDELHLDQGHIPPWKATTFAHASADERWSLPIDLWGRGEDFYWYCNWGTCQNTQLDRRFLADVTLYAKLLRSMARGKPYLINKYDFYRPRNMLAEAAALGMVAGAIAVPYRTAEDADVMAHYFKFIERHGKLFADNNGESVADVLMVFPRTAIHAGDAEGLEMIEAAGRTMITGHVLFDMVPDDLLDTIRLERYRLVIAAETTGLDAAKLKTFVSAGGRLIAVPRTSSESSNAQWRKLGAAVVAGLPPHSGGSPQAKPFRDALEQALGSNRAQFNAPYTVEPHVYRQPGRYVIHLVNYNHQEKAPGKAVVEREAPLSAEPVGVRLPLPDGVRATRVRFLDPDGKSPSEIKFAHKQNVLVLTTPSFLVYGICVVEVEE